MAGSLLRTGLVAGAILVAALLGFADVALARVVDGAELTTDMEGFTLEVQLRQPLTYINHQMSRNDRVLLIQLRPVAGLVEQDEDLLRELQEREDVAWDKSKGTAISQIVFDGNDTDRPTITVYFSRPVSVEKVANSRDLRGIVIQAKDPGMRDFFERISSGIERQPSAAVEELPALSPERLESMMADAEQALAANETGRAIQLFTRIVRSPANKYSERAQELLGVAREQKGQLAHARAEYQEYLRRYPDSEGADRVRQRLATLVTAAQPAGEGPSRKPRRKVAEGGWETDFYGSFSTFYNRDQVNTDEEGNVVNRSDMTFNLDANASARKGSFEVNTRFAGSLLYDFQAGTGDKDVETRLSTGTVELREEKSGLFGIIGRQSSRNASGVHTRFDGAIAGYEVSDNLVIKGIFGYPVDSTRDSPVNTNRHFYGANVELKDLLPGLDTVFFFMDQTVNGITDRRAIGAEIQYANKDVNVFTLVDYDIFYDDLNLFLFVGQWRFTEKTRASLTLDYRNSPLLATTNAIQGQGVETVEELFPLYTDDEIFQFAMDRTARAKTGTLSITHDLSEHFQLTGEVTLTKTGPTDTSGGVVGDAGTQTESYYSIQLLASQLFFETDISVVELRFADTTRNRIYTFNLNTRMNLTDDLRINPRLRIDYREAKDGSSERLLFRPQLRLEYKWRRWLRFEVEGGAEFVDETANQIKQNSTGWFLFAGFVTLW